MSQDPSFWDTWGQLLTSAIGAFIGVLGAIGVWWLAERRRRLDSREERRVAHGMLVVDAGRSLGLLAEDPESPLREIRAAAGEVRHAMMVFSIREMDLLRDGDWLLGWTSRISTLVELLAVTGEKEREVRRQLHSDSAALASAAWGWLMMPGTDITKLEPVPTEWFGNEEPQER